MLKRSLLPVALLLAPLAAHAATLVRDVPAGSIPLVGERLIQPAKLRALELDLKSIEATLRAAPVGGVGAPVRLVLPMPDGSEMAFNVVDAGVMAPGLMKKYPGVRAYSGVAVNDPRITGRFNLGPRGFRSMITTLEGRAYIDPYSRGDTRYYQSYWAKDLPAKRRVPDQVLSALPAKAGLAPKIAAPKAATPKLDASASKGISVGGELRKYRLAIATTGEYSQFHDPTGDAVTGLPRKDVVLDELVVVTNRVTGVYEREVGVTFELVANNDLVIFQNDLADPYKNDDGTTMLLENTAILHGLIGPTNYDVGHVVSTGGGGVAMLGVPCDDALKGAGVTGLPTPVTDDFYIDYVAHEMGHEFGGEHTFNGTLGSCAGNGSAATAQEPGSGVTIMAYAGICGTDDIARHSIDTFHAASFDQISALIRGSGNICAVKTTPNNRAPVVAPMPTIYTIPKGTPFELTGSATDPDGDAVTYQWEEVDRGTMGPPNIGATDSNATTGGAPLFRSFLPTVSPTRTFPRMSDIIEGTQTVGEILPQVARKVKFRLTARDNKVAPSSGGVGSEDQSLTVVNTAGPFRVTAPATTADVGSGGSLAVAWNVANTTASPVSCSAVDISLSTDGAQTFPTVLASATPNDGAETVTLPDITSNSAHIKVKCSNNVFFDVSRVPVRIVKAAPALSLAGYENPDNNGAYTLSWTRPAQATGPDVVEQSSSCDAVSFSDDAEEPLVAADNGKWHGNLPSQWVSAPHPETRSLTYHVENLVNQDEALFSDAQIPIPAGGTATLSFDSRESFEDGYDIGRVAVSIDGGTTFIALANYTGPGGLFPNNFRQVRRSLDLTPYAGKSVVLRFRIISDVANSDVYSGWYIDNVQVTTTSFATKDVVSGTSIKLSGQPVGNYCHRVRAGYVIDGKPETGPASNVVFANVAQTNVAPVARLAVSVASGTAPLAVNLSAAASTDADGDALVGYSFDFGDGSDIVDQAAATASHTYSAPGTYTPSVIAHDARGADSQPATAVITVAPSTTDTQPDAFGFADRPGVATSVFITSEGVTLGGFDAAAPISVTNGQYSLDGGAYTNASGTVLPGQVLRVRHVSASTSSTTVATTVTAGGTSATFRSTTSDVDRTPNAFNFVTQEGAAAGSLVESNVATPSGFDTAISIVPAAGQSWRIGGAGDWSTGNGTLLPGQTIQVRHTASATAGAYVKTTLRLGGVACGFTTRTAP